jgi:hypothetical protein
MTGEGRIVRRNFRLSLVLHYYYVSSKKCSLNFCTECFVLASVKADLSVRARPQTLESSLRKVLVGRDQWGGDGGVGGPYSRVEDDQRQLIREHFANTTWPALYGICTVCPRF